MGQPRVVVIRNLLEFDWTMDLTHDNGDRQKLLVHSAVEVQRLDHHLVRVFEARMRRVPLLPQKLPRAQERRGVLKLPPGRQAGRREKERKQQLDVSTCTRRHASGGGRCVPHTTSPPPNGVCQHGHASSE